MSDNVFYGLVAGVVIVGAASFYGIYTYFNSNSVVNQVQTTQITTPTPITPRPAEKITGSNSTPSLVQSIAVSSSVVVEKGNLLKKIKFAVPDKDKFWHYYSSLEDAIDKLKTLESGDWVLKIGFPSQLILSSKTKEEFWAWLARVGDYIYARRFSLVRDTTDVVRNKIFYRAQADNISEKGNIIFSEETDFWWIEIRGLEKSVEEIQKVAGFIERAINAPETTNACAEFITQALSSKISMYLLLQKELALKDKEVTLINDLVKFSHTNSLGCPLESDFSQAESITDTQRLKLQEEMNNYLKNFIEEILPKISAQPNAEREQCLAVRGACYQKLVLSEKKWVIQTLLSNILEQSLFIE